MKYSKNPLLSICIPTYGRPVFTLRTLESIRKQMTDEVELVVVDDGSIDGTFEVIELFKKAYPDNRIRVEKNKKNLGFDANVLKVMSKGTGKYLWLFGNDDLLNPGAIKRVLSVIKKNSDTALIHVNYSRFDNTLQRVTAEKMVGSITRDRIFTNYLHFYFLEIKDSYFRFLGTNTITMSTDIFKASEWRRSTLNIERFIGHNFIHSFVVGRVILQSKKIYYVAAPVVQYLANNHRVWPNDIWKDYNSVLLNYLLDLGFPTKEIEYMRKKQKKYEQSETIMKSPLVNLLYPIVSPILSLYRYVRDKNRKK